MEIDKLVCRCGSDMFVIASPVPQESDKLRDQINNPLMVKCAKCGANYKTGNDGKWTLDLG